MSLVVQRRVVELGFRVVRHSCKVLLMMPQLFPLLRREALLMREVLNKTMRLLNTKYLCGGAAASAAAGEADTPARHLQLCAD